MENRVDTIRESKSQFALMLCVGWLLVVMLMWALAFYHRPGENPAWLRQAQNVCFGINENGLPNSGGWLLLVLSPLMLMSALLLIMGGEVKDQVRAMWDSKSGKFLAILLGAMVLIEAAWVNTRLQEAWRIQAIDFSSQDLGGLPNAYPRQAWPAASFELIDQSGKHIQFPGAPGRIKILSFVFAHCQTVCPAILHTMETATKTEPNAFDIYLVTLDPWRDTPSTLPDLAVHWGFGANTHFLSGEVAQVKKVLDDYRVPRERVEKNGDVIHPALVYVVDAKGQVAYAFNNPSAQWLLDAVKRLS